MSIPTMNKHLNPNAPSYTPGTTAKIQAAGAVEKKTTSAPAVARGNTWNPYVLPNTSAPLPGERSSSRFMRTYNVNAVNLGEKIWGDGFVNRQVSFLSTYCQAKDPNGDHVHTEACDLFAPFFEQAVEAASSSDDKYTVPKSIPYGELLQLPSHTQQEPPMMAAARMAVDGDDEAAAAGLYTLEARREQMPVAKVLQIDMMAKRVGPRSGECFQALANYVLGPGKVHIVEYLPVVVAASAEHPNPKVSFSGRLSLRGTDEESIAQLVAALHWKILFDETRVWVAETPQHQEMFAMAILGVQRDANFAKALMMSGTYFNGMPTSPLVCERMRDPVEEQRILRISHLFEQAFFHSVLTENRRLKTKVTQYTPPSTGQEFNAAGEVVNGAAVVPGKIHLVLREDTTESLSMMKLLKERLLLDHQVQLSYSVEPLSVSKKKKMQQQQQASDNPRHKNKGAAPSPQNPNASSDRRHRHRRNGEQNL